jgi:hypothetical protein
MVAMNVISQLVGASTKFNTIVKIWQV